MTTTNAAAMAAAARRGSRGAGPMSPARVAALAMLLMAVLLGVATGGEASSLRALRTVSTGGPTVAATTASPESVPETKGLTEVDDPEYVAALEADYDKAKEDELAYKVYKVLDYIHKAHVGLEFAEMAEHHLKHLAHDQQLLKAWQATRNAFSTEVSALRTVFPNYKAAWSTSNTFVALRKVVQSASAPNLVAKLEGAVAAAKSNHQARALAESLVEARKWISTNMPAVRSSAAYLAEYGRALRALKDTWFAGTRPFFAALAKVGPQLAQGGRTARVAAQPLVTMLGSIRVQVVRAGFAAIGRTSMAVTRLASAGGRFAVASLEAVLSHKFIHAVLYLGVAFEAANGMLNSKTSTVPGLIVDGVLKGGIGYLIMSNPWVALADLVLPKALRLSSMIKGASDILLGLCEAVVAGNPEMLNRVHAASLKGEYGFLFNLASATGEALAGNWQHIEALNEKNTSGKNGAILHLASGYGELIFNGNFESLDKYQKMALAGEHGVVAKVIADAGEYWAREGLIGGLGLTGPYEAILSSDTFGRPENKAVVVYKMPDRKGLYVKIRSCTAGAVGQASRAVWTCRPLSGGANRRERRLLTAKSTNVGHPSGGTVKWDPNSDPAKAGYGLFWKDVTRRTVTCALSNSVRMWPDDHFPGTQLTIFASSPNTGKFVTVPVLRNNVKMGTCEVLTNLHE